MTSLPVPGLYSPTSRMLRWGLWLATAGLLALLAIYATDGLDLAERTRFVRVLGIWTAFGLGIATPHILLPDPHLRLLQLANPTPARLLHGQIRRWLPIPLALTVPALIVASTSDGPVATRALLALEGALTTLGTGLYSLARYSTVGERSWDWQDDRRGGWLKDFIAKAPAFKLFVPYGLVPGLGLTLEVAAVGSVVALLGERVLDGTPWAWVPAAVLVGLGARRLIASSRRFDRAFYATSGFWAETFQSAEGTEEERAPAPFSAVYWVPTPLKPSVWALLVSLDRRLPLGRFVVVGIAAVVGLAISGAPSGVLGAALAVLIMAKNTASALTASAAVLPRPWSLSVQSAMRWFAARVFVNLRWTLLIAVAALLVGGLGDRPGPLLAWVGIDVAISILAAALVTLAAESQIVRKLA